MSDTVDREHICDVTFDYNYNPTFLYNKILDEFKKHSEVVVCPKDNKEFPFTLKQIEIFLESCASLALFLKKNELLRDGFMFNLDSDDEVIIRSEILIDEVIGFTCLDSKLIFSPNVDSLSNEINLDSELRTVRKYEEEDDPIFRKKRIFTHKSIVGPFNENEISKMKYFPRCVGYDIDAKSIILKNFKISEEIKENDFPLYINIPYVQDYINYCFENNSKR